ncbi:hypothetical protein [Mycobacterium sp. GA-1199]|nr:hypothetical protein [Mycobacterium sp. GA-1199]
MSDLKMSGSAANSVASRDDADTRLVCNQIAKSRLYYGFGDPSAH